MSRTAAALEVIVQSLDDAVAAEAGGADRLELVRDLARDGLTPDIGLAAAICERVRIPVRVMIRDEEPFMASSPAVIERMRASAAAFGRLPIDGLVIGILLPDGAVALDAMRTVLDAAPGCRATFHRAIEHVRNLDEALAQIGTLPPVDRVLSAGNPGGWADRVRVIKQMSAAAPAGVRVMMAVGLESDGLKELEPLPVDVHIGRAARSPHAVDAPVSADEVRRVRQMLHRG